MYTLFPPSENPLAQLEKHIDGLERLLGADVITHFIAWGEVGSVFTPVMDPEWALRGFAEFGQRIRDLYSVAIHCSEATLLFLHNPPLDVIGNADLIRLVQITPRVKVTIFIDDPKYHAEVHEYLTAIAI